MPGEVVVRGRGLVDLIAESRAEAPGWLAVTEKKQPKVALGNNSAALTGRVLPSRTGYMPGVPDGGLNEYTSAVGASTGTDRRSTLQELWDAYLACPWSYTCVQVIARTITAGGLYTDWDQDDGEGDQEQPEKPPEVVALERFYAFCNPTQDIRQLLRNVIADLMVFGDALLEIVWSGPTPVAIYNLDVPTTSPVTDSHGNILSWVQVTDQGQRAEFESREVIHISLDSARPGVFGTGPTQAMLMPIMAWLWASATEKEMLRKGMPPAVHADLPNTMGATETTRWLNQYRAQNLGSRNIGVPITTKGGGKITVLPTGQLSEVLAAKTMARDEIVAGYGVPPAEAGIIESGNIGGGTGDAQHKSFMINTCGPVGEVVLEKLNFHIAVQGFGVQGWRSKFREVDYRDSVTIEQIRDTRVRNGAWTRNRYAAEIGEPRVAGGDEPVLVERQAIIAWKDVGRFSDAQIAQVEAAGMMAGAQPAGGGHPGETLARKGMMREALVRFAAGELTEAADPGNAVYKQLAKSFPAKAIAWVKSAKWTGPEWVPLDRINMSDRDSWAASHDGQQPGHRSKLRKALKAGRKPKPVVLVKRPGHGKLIIPDGHHRVLAALAENQDKVWAYVGTVKSKTGDWDQMHSSQLGGNS